MSDDGTSKFTLRLPEDLHARLAHAAQTSGRSLNGEMLHRLAASFEVADLQAVVPILLNIGERLASIEEAVSVSHIANTKAEREMAAARAKAGLAPEKP